LPSRTMGCAVQRHSKVGVAGAGTGAGGGACPQAALAANRRTQKRRVLIQFIGLEIFSESRGSP